MNKKLNMTISKAEQKKDFLELSEAAEQDNAISQLLLVLTYKGGWGTPQSKVLAYKWLIICESNPNESTETHRNNVRHLINLSAKNMTPEEIAEAEKLADDWIKANRREARMDASAQEWFDANFKTDKKE